jgi:tripartite-type tricarboxylate transporter receptor subunit TctC
MAHAQPAKTLRIIVPYGPGGTGDVIARLVAQEITQGTGQAVVVDNRPGGGGVIGAAAAAKADPDGSTLLLGYTSELVISPSLVKGVAYATDRDFRPVAFAGLTPLLLIAGNNVPGNTLAEFVSAAKAKPNAYSYATAGNGSPAHIAGALLARITGTQLLNVPYKGGAQAVTDVLAGNVSIYFLGHAAGRAPGQGRQGQGPGRRGQKTFTHIAGRARSVHCVPRAGPGRLVRVSCASGHATCGGQRVA